MYYNNTKNFSQRSLSARYNGNYQDGCKIKFFFRKTLSKCEF